VYATTPTDALLHPLDLAPARGAGCWGDLLTLVAMFNAVGIFVALVHSCPFRLQLLLAPFQMAHHLLLGLPHQLRAVDALGLGQLVGEACSTLHMLMDPSFQGGWPDTAPAHCAAAPAPGFFLLYTYALLSGVLPAHLMYRAERRHKEAFLRSLEPEPAAGAADWECPHGAAALLMHAWAACAIAWSGLIIAFTLCGV
jgi:hypothetical protein